ncbi:MAG: hypothetical protein ACKO85_01400 [Isosphaeraceae bacterium]
MPATSLFLKGLIVNTFTLSVAGQVLVGEGSGFSATRPKVEPAGLEPVRF